MIKRVLGVTFAGVGIALLAANPAWAGSDTGKFETTDGGRWLGAATAGGWGKFEQKNNRWEFCDNENDGQQVVGTVYRGSHPDGQARINQRSGRVINAYYSSRVDREDGGLSECNVNKESNGSIDLDEGKTYTFEVCVLSDDRLSVSFCERRVAEA